MSAAGTVVATSVDGAGDMPSSVPVTSGDASHDDAQPFSEVLSRSSAELPGSPSSSPPPSPSVVPDEPHAHPDAAPSTVPDASSADTAGSSGGRGRREAGPPGPGDRHVLSTAGSPAPLSRRGTPDKSARRDISPTEAEIGALDEGHTQGPPVPPATPAAPAVPTASTSVVTSTPTDGSVVSAVGTGTRSDGDVLATLAPAAEDGPGPSTIATTGSADAQGVGSNPEPARGSDAPADRTPEMAGVRRSDERVSAEGVPSGAAVLHTGPVRILASGSAPGATEVLPPATAGTSESLAVAAAEVPELAEFPDSGGGTAGASLDISDLAASISRPLAGGNGDYSVQVSLHPPELGEVRALLSLQGDVLHITLTPEHATGFQALSEAMPALHDQLAGGGVEVNVTLGQPGDPQGGDGGRAAEPAPAGSALSDGAALAATPSAIPTTSGDPDRIHLVL